MRKHVLYLGIRCGNKLPLRKSLLMTSLFRLQRSCPFLSFLTKTNKRETRFNNYGNPGPGSTTIMFGKKSNLCCGQNAFLSHYSQSLLKACQEINETLFVQLPTSMHSIQQSLASSEVQSKVKPKRTHWLGRGSVLVELCSVGTLAPRHLLHCKLCPATLFGKQALLNSASAMRPHPCQYHASCQREAFI